MSLTFSTHNGDKAVLTLEAEHINVGGVDIPLGLPVIAISNWLYVTSEAIEVCTGGKCTLNDCIYEESRCRYVSLMDIPTLYQRGPYLAQEIKHKTPTE